MYAKNEKAVIEIIQERIPLGIMLMAYAAGVQCESDPAQLCSNEGDIYRDDCNTCVCGKYTSLQWWGGCTHVTCQPKENMCIYGGNAYKNGDQWNSIDGCNTCA